MEPLVTVLLPVFNGSAFLNQAIDSILNQTYTNIDFLIIDDGSTDHSLDIVKSYRDERIRLVKNERNLGLTASFNKGIDLAKGKYVARMDADDISEETRFEKQVSYLEMHPEVAMVDCIMQYISIDGTPLKRIAPEVFSYKEIKRTLPFTNYLGHSSIMIRTDIYKLYKYRNVQYEDYELWLRLVNDNHIIHKIPEPLLKYRIHGNSYTDIGKKKKGSMLNLAITKRKYLLNIPFINFFKIFNIKILLYMILQYIGGYIKYYTNFKK